MFDTKILDRGARRPADLAEAQRDGFPDERVVGAAPEIIGEPYRDAAGNLYSSLSRQPVIVLTADQPTIGAIHRRALERGVRHALYIEEMFATGHDAANRTVFAEHTPETAKVVGLALREERKLVDKITKGARMHP